MNKEFIPYEQALALKELGFDFEDYDILGFYSKKYGVTTHSQLTKNDGYNPAIIYQQAFRWFREKHEIVAAITVRNDDFDYTIFIPWNIECYEDNTKYNTYEEAELACLDKLIEIVNNK